MQCRAQVNLSHEFTELGLLERENASVLNACLRPLADKIMPTFAKALQGQSLLFASAHGQSFMAT